MEDRLDQIEISRRWEIRITVEYSEHTYIFVRTGTEDFAVESALEGLLEHTANSVIRITCEPI